MIVIGDLAVETVVAFVGVDRAVGFNRLDLAFVGTDAAGLAALFAPVEPVEDSKLGRDHQRGT